MGFLDVLIWFFFGEFFIAIFLVILVSGCFDFLATLIGFPTESVKDIINMVMHYFWPAFLAGGFLTSATQKKRVALIVAVLWVLILVLFCFVPGNVSVPKVEKVAAVEITYAYDLYEQGDKVFYDYKGHSFKDPEHITQVIEMIEDARYTHTHKEVLTRNDPLYDRLMIEFLDEDGKSLKKLTIINQKGICVEGKMKNRYYRIRENTGFDVALIDRLARNGA